MPSPQNEAGPDEDESGSPVLSEVLVVDEVVGVVVLVVFVVVGSLVELDSLLELGSVSTPVSEALSPPPPMKSGLRSRHASSNGTTSAR